MGGWVNGWMNGGLGPPPRHDADSVATTPHAQVDKWDLKERTLELPAGLSSGDVVEVMDAWEDMSHPGSIMTSAAFTKARRRTSQSLSAIQYFGRCGGADLRVG
jgi:hypothetical protein